MNCGAVQSYEPWVCTLPCDHAGDHVATDANEDGQVLRGYVYSRWPQDAPLVRVENFVQTRTVTVEKVVPPTVDALARSLFETDERVLAHVRVRSESQPRDAHAVRDHIRAYLASGQRDELGPARWSRVMQISWDLNVAQLRTQAMERAGAMLRALPTGSKAEP